jgi:hypothetical protein
MVSGSGVPGLGDEGPLPHDTAKNRVHTAKANRFIVISLE